MSEESINSSAITPDEVRTMADKSKYLGLRTSRGLMHLKDNLLVAFDLETTGTDPTKHEILQFAMIPLDHNLEPMKDTPFLELYIRPDNIESISMDALRINRQKLDKLLQYGMPKDKALEMFEYYFERMKLPMGKKIVALGYNVAAFDMHFCQQWMGMEMYSHYFTGHTRDAYQVANYINDAAYVRAMPIPFPKMKLREIASALGMDLSMYDLHDAVHDALLSSVVYKKLLRHQILVP